ncbi:MAG: hypothetical protein IPL33_17090 [Sphingobacteriales bacterium]|nr:hypothetical protein [Sphingobacteriales bacterium]MCC7222686.1 hypothetical protein [Chitinophagales bacterium]
MLFKINSLLLFGMVPILMAMSTCQKDTCNGKKTFAAMQAQISNIGNEAAIYLNYELDEALPINYIKQIKVSKRDIDYQGNTWANDYALIKNIVVTPTQIVIHLNNLGAFNDTSPNWHFNLELPDRRGYINCDHAGNDDVYYFDIYTKTIFSEQNTKISSFEWKEFLNKGAI